MFNKKLNYSYKNVATSYGWVKSSKLTYIFLVISIIVMSISWYLYNFTNYTSNLLHSILIVISIACFVLAIVSINVARAYYNIYCNNKYIGDICVDISTATNTKKLEKAIKRRVKKINKTEARMQNIGIKEEGKF